MSNQDTWSPFSPPILPPPLAVTNQHPQGFDSNTLSDPYTNSGNPSWDTSASRHQTPSSTHTNSTDRYTRRPYATARSPPIAQPLVTHSQDPVGNHRQSIPPPYERRRRSISFAAGPDTEYDTSEKVESEEEHRYRNEKSHGMLSRMIALHEEGYNGGDEYSSPQVGQKSDGDIYSESKIGVSLIPRRRRATSGASLLSMGSHVVDEDDPRITGKRLTHLDDTEDNTLSSLRHLDYKGRRKERNRMRVIYHITCTSYSHTAP
jgi:hypothetical protein